jgi:hypothetical protein
MVVRPRHALAAAAILAAVTLGSWAALSSDNLFVISGCQLRQVWVAGAGALQILVGGSVGHACSATTVGLRGCDPPLGPAPALRQG